MGACFCDPSGTEITYRGKTLSMGPYAVFDTFQQFIQWVRREFGLGCFSSSSLEVIVNGVAVSPAACWTFPTDVTLVDRAVSPAEHMHFYIRHGSLVCNKLAELAARDPRPIQVVVE